MVRKSVTEICPGAEAFLTAPKVAAEPKVSPANRDTMPVLAIDMVIIGPLACFSCISSVAASAGVATLRTLAAFALTGFANFASVGIQLGGISGIAPERRHDLARLGLRALFVGFMATLLNASIAGVLLE